MDAVAKNLQNDGVRKGSNEITGLIGMPKRNELDRSNALEVSFGALHCNFETKHKLLLLNLTHCKPASFYESKQKRRNKRERIVERTC